MEPSTIQETLIKAVELQTQGDLDAASTLFHEVLKVDTHNAAALYSLSVIALNAGDSVKALQLSTRGIQFNPQFAPLRYIHTTILQNQAIELQNQGKPDAAAKLFHELLELDADNAIALYSLSLIAHNSGNSAEALKLSTHGTQSNPKFAPLWLIHGAILQAMGNKDEALLGFDAALEIQPETIDALLNSGALLRSMYRHHEALERFNKIIGIDPNNASALNNLGILLTEFKQSERAIEMFERLLKIKPDYDYALGLLFYEKMHVCDWSDFDAQVHKIVAEIRAGL